MIRHTCLLFHFLKWKFLLLQKASKYFYQPFSCTRLYKLNLWEPSDEWPFTGLWQVFPNTTLLLYTKACHYRSKNNLIMRKLYCFEGIYFIYVLMRFPSFPHCLLGTSHLLTLLIYYYMFVLPFLKQSFSRIFFTVIFIWLNIHFQALRGWMNARI